MFLHQNLMCIVRNDFYRQYGIRESKELTIEGRVQFDLLQVICYFCVISLRF